ncbi:ATP-binding protein [Paralimibaculum aggregatum]|uniref:histidine kinase n=1 Tax=Paralimibaculum aggregatum TaxID=3036245 RepID=A0ABQ6LJ05_9RHOB|nr:sensor histidine kinase [Limibaculum sp. NKW23]GMG83266.1 ATP-binding protein [Limibaculum sp. NKW23]
MFSPDRLLLFCLAYVVLLFAVAWIGDRRAQAGKMAWLRSPVIYTLSISIYCTSWTFYGAVGSAARGGLDFITIYLGPTLVFVGWWWLLRKLVHIGRTHRITSIADLISSRYGKSPALAVVVTLIAVTATTPYIALQLQSVALSYSVVAGEADHTRTAFWVAAGMAIFTILFGTRSIDANERHHGVVVAIALEALVKLTALVAVGLFVVFGVMGGVGETFARMPEGMIRPEEVFDPRWAALTFLSATAIICLPRQFQVTVVENSDPRHLATASWLFPLYLFLMCLFVVPIAIVGLTDAAGEAGDNPDMFMLTVPLAAGQDELALLAFIGGFSSATSMVIVAAIALSTMVSNHIVMPLTLRFLDRAGAISGDVRDLLLISRRICIGVVLGLGFLYYLIAGGSESLAAIGLIAFAGIAQVLPSLVGALYWRGATRAGAMWGLVAGAALWAYTLFLPSFGGQFLISGAVLAEGPWGLGLLRPQALMGLGGTDPLIHALIWSLGVNTFLFITISQVTRPAPIEQVQGALFVDVLRVPGREGRGIVHRSAAPEDLFVLAQRILGAEPARQLFEEMAREQGLATGLPRPTDGVIARLERELAGSVGAASAHAMVTRAAGAGAISLTELIDIADETQRLLATSLRLADKTAELERTAVELREANTRLRALDAQKDDFLSHVSHELRTPMTSIRSFSEILLMEKDLDPAQMRHFVTIIHEESQRLTRLLNEILDINRLESGSAEMRIEIIDAEDAVSGAIETLRPVAAGAGVVIRPHADLRGQFVLANADRLRQVLINLVSNAIKYNAAEAPEVRIEWSVQGKSLCIDVIDNGGGVSREEAETVFSKFFRGVRSAGHQGAGLGLPISRAAIRRMGGDLTVVFNADQTSFFRLRLPRVATGAGERGRAGEEGPGEGQDAAAARGAAE